MTETPQSPEVVELVLFARNIQHLNTKMTYAASRQHHLRESGVALAFILAATEAVRLYTKEFGTKGAMVFTAENILQAATDLCGFYTEQVKEPTSLLESSP